MWDVPGQFGHWLLYTLGHDASSTSTRFWSVEVPNLMSAELKLELELKLENFILHRL